MGENQKAMENAGINGNRKAGMENKVRNEGEILTDTAGQEDAAIGQLEWEAGAEMLSG